MPHSGQLDRKIGAALVVGGGIGGMQAAIDLANSGIKVYLAERCPSIGGKMSQLDKTFPTNDCAMCTMAPRLVEIGRNKDIDVITLSDLESIEGDPGNFRVTLNRKARFVDEDKCTGCGDCEEVCPIRIPDEYNLKIGETKAIRRTFPQAVPGSYAIEKLGQAPCRYACPVGQKAQGYIALIREKRYEDAYHVILRDNPLPSVCGRICKCYCEDECTRSRVDEPVSIESLKRFIADWAYDHKLARKKPKANGEPAETASKRVAVIGSGPAGLTAARDLCDMGYSITILEALPEPGGMMWAGIPEFRLPRERLTWDIQNILLDDIELRTGHRVESIDALMQEGFEAVFIATGMHTGKKLPIPGHDLSGSMASTDLLRTVANGQKVALEDRILVLGGGDVAIDVARTAVRLGSRKVCVVCLESRENMPADSEEVEAAEQEGVTILPSRSVLEILSRDGKVAGAKCIRVLFRAFDEYGKPDMDLRVGTEHAVEADAIIFAIGQMPDIPFADEGLRLTEMGTIAVDEMLATSKPGVFAGGDVVTGARFIVDAIAAGHRAARSIDRYLNDGELRIPEPQLLKVELTDEEIQARIRSENRRHNVASLPAEERKKNFAEHKQGYTEDMAIAEALRCLECGICSECLLCQEACDIGAIDHQRGQEELLALDVGAIILAPGFSVFDAESKKDLGYGRFANVILSLEFERILSASGPFSGQVVRPSDGKPPKRIAFLQCVGSRDSEREYCSSVCCMYSTKEAIIAKEHIGDNLECDIFFMDLRAFGKRFDEYYERAKEVGVNYIRCRPPALIELPGSKDLQIEFLAEDDRRVSREYDMVVLAAGMAPPPDAWRIAKTAGLPLNDFGFCRTSAFRPAEPGRDGIYVAGCFTEPKDIPETVMQGSAAASRALTLLKDYRYTLIEDIEYPPERDVTSEEARIGLFVCHCGANIASVVKVEDVAEYARTLPNVVHAESNLYACSNDAQQRIKERIEELDLNRVVVASCTPRTHEPLFRKTIREAGLNPYLFEMANIRDQCSWVHREYPDAATEKAKGLVRMAAAKVRLSEPLPQRSVMVNKAALVIGGGLSGMTCANELADQDFNVFLLEKEKELGGKMKRIHFLIGGEDPQEELAQLVDRTNEHERISVFTETAVESIEGSVGNFVTTVSSNGDSTELVHGVVIVATGAGEYIPTEYFYGQDERIITQLELEERLSKNGDTPMSSSGDLPKTVVMIQCVGSRDDERPYCSRICCTEAVKNALKIKELSPETNVYVLYRDIRVYGLKEWFYSEARRKGVAFARYGQERKPVVTRNGDDLRVEVFDQTLGLTIEIDADLIILSAGVVAQETDKETARLLKVPLDSNGFFLEAHLKLRPVEFSNAGVFLCGLAHSSKMVEESISQARAAASKASAILSKDEFELEACVSQVIDSKCDGCAYCIDPCPAKAISLIEYMSKGALKKTVDADEVACEGCGCCQATCPKEGIRVLGFTLEQLYAQVDAALEKTPYGDESAPIIVAFCCNWCSYAGADLAGVSRLQYPANLRIIRVMCSSMVHPDLVIHALMKGADGVVICGCHPGDCHYVEGNLVTEKRAEAIQLLLEDFGLEEERFRLEWISASEGPKFARVMNEVVDTISQLGPSPYS